MFLLLQVAGPQTGDTVISGVPLFPSSASTMAGQVDSLFWFLFSFSAAMSLAIFICIITFAIKYRRRAPNEIGAPISGSALIETIWIVIPLLIALFIFGWGATLYYNIEHAPPQPMQVYVIGKQWMWKLQHPEGRVEINELHVPVGRDIMLTMTSQDVIHDFFVPAFRLHADVVPGSYVSEWFHPTKVGQFHLFCSQYCGTNHSLMGGWITVMDPADFQNWLAGSTEQKSMSELGFAVFQEHGCSSCHEQSASARGPSLANLYNGDVRLDNGQTVKADDAYLRESILNPRAKLVAGFRTTMPSYQGQISEEQILQLIAYIKSLANQKSSQTAGSSVSNGKGVIQ